MNNPNSNLLNFSQFLKTYYTLNSALCQELNDNYLTLFSFLSCLNSIKILYRCVMQKSRDILILSHLKRKNLSTIKGLIPGGRTGSQCQEIFSNYLQFSQIIVPAAGLSQIRLLYPNLRHLTRESTWQTPRGCAIIGAGHHFRCCTAFGARGTLIIV